MYKHITLLFGLFLIPFSVFSQSTNYIPADSLVSFYEFKNNFNDTGPNNYNGSISGDIAYITDRDGNTNSAIELGNGVGLLPNDIFKFSRDSSFTISFWFTNNNTSNDNRLISTECSEGNFRVTSNDGNISLQFGDYLTPELKSPAQWNHIVYTYENYSENIYLNGNLEITNIDNKVEELTPYCNPFTVGAKASATFNNRWNGNFDDLGIWNRVLEGNEIMSLYYGEKISLSNKLSVGIKDTSFVETEFVSTVIEVDSVAWHDSLSAYQFDLIIPEGVNFSSYDTSGTLSNNGLIEHRNTGDTLALAYSSQEFLEGNEKGLIKLNFEVVEAGDYGFELNEFYFNAFKIDSADGGLISFVPLLGDVDDNSSIQAYDASLVLMNSVGKDGIPSIDPLPWERWRELSADVNKDGNILAEDASLILQKSVGLIDDFNKSKAKQNDAFIEVEAIEDTLIFSSPTEHLLGANINIPDTDNVEFFDPIYPESGLLTAENKVDNIYKFGLASSKSIEESFLKIPYRSEDNQNLEIEIYSNSSYSTKTVNLNQTTTSNELNSDLPDDYKLNQNFPNPFNPSTTITFNIPSSTFVTLEVFSVTGAKIGTLISKKINAGSHSIDFNASNLSTGVYYYKLKTSEFEQVKSMMLIK